MPILFFFLAHWFASLFFQSFFLHRYASHRMFSMSPFWERFFYLATFIAQGSSFINPRAYAIMHRDHHTHSDTELDPHSPNRHKTVLGMMTETYHIYKGIMAQPADHGDRFSQTAPRWNGFDRLADHWAVRLFFVGGYTAFYIAFAPGPWYFLLLPVHFVMGPVHGAIVNWCGHKYGYVNFRETNDQSRNSLPIDLLAMGELFQNNHHRYPRRPNFALRRFEFDPTYPILLGLDALRIIRLRRSTQST